MDTLTPILATSVILEQHPFLYWSEGQLWPEEIPLHKLFTLPSKQIYNWSETGGAYFWSNSILSILKFSVFDAKSPHGISNYSSKFWFGDKKISLEVHVMPCSSSLGCSRFTITQFLVTCFVLVTYIFPALPIGGWSHVSALVLQENKFVIRMF